ncbi:MAG: enoyl-CoA hydratase/isomerase family protein [Acidimicrobiaceae bacterium]|nr:enoyl-CoA hydratase/isomerase family protein [Acidimicrobiaceae bacterium]MYL03133.1 enoyl-CoA hydratase/isomerase family protein [Acidimicrobiaceae bacterium]
MDYETITVGIDGPVGTLALDVPAKLNPLSVACLLELTDAARWFDGHEDVKAVIVRGNGRAFTAGADLAAFTGGGGFDRAGTDAGRVMAEALTAMQAVTVAAIHGHCVGGGVVLAAACDLRVATDDVRFVIPEVDLGIPLAWGGIPRLVREVGPAATRDLVMTCRPFGAAEAQALGFVNRVVPAAELDGTVQELARQLAAKSAYTLRATLRAVDAAAEALVPTGGAWNDADSLAAARRDPESREAARRYLESLGR